MRFFGRFRGHPLAPGTYSITVVAWRGGARSGLGRISVEVVPPGRRSGRTHGPAPVFAGCSSGLAAGFPFSDATFGGSSSSTLVPGVGRVPFRPPTLKPPLKPGGGIDLGALNVRIPHSSGTLGWLAVFVFAASGIAGAAFLVSVLRFVRGTWNP